ncbi:MAG: hypothetical protein GY737_27405 [Desulfobacteraceae bacterium]|nr:hypothetical protein [Desulfobacteraceae bacterium]
MIRTLKPLVILVVVVLLLPGALLAGTGVRTGIRVIHASSGAVHVDPGLGDLGPELKSVFKYTSYKLIKQTAMDLDRGARGRVRLPGGRTLEVVPLDLTGRRIKYRIGIFKRGTRVFGTEVLLRNRGSITIGGPRFKNGYLLFNISGTRR